jgi:hypothetical protein
MASLANKSFCAAQTVAGTTMQGYIVFSFLIKRFDDKQARTWLETRAQ